MSKTDLLKLSGSVFQWKPPSDLPEAEWRAIGAALGRIERSINAALLNYHIETLVLFRWINKPANIGPNTARRLEAQTRGGCGALPLCPAGAIHPPGGGVARRFRKSPLPSPHFDACQI
jgi:hypothetical protein